MLEAGEVVVPLELTHSTYGDHIVMSTGDIAFIACGAFSGFQQVARRRGAVDKIGFGRSTHKASAAQTGKAPPGSLGPDAIAVSFSTDEVENIANFQAYGFLPELMARFTRIVPFRALDAGTLKDILRGNVIDRLTREFEDEGFRLTVSEEALDHVVAESLRRETGARGLAAILTRHLEDAAFDTFADHPGGEVRLVLDGDSELKVELD
jgi:ATP-dependent Clp protease ATP-binding subunit ClpX